VKVILFANTDWYLYNYRLPLARALRQIGYEVILLSPRGDYAARLQAEGFIWREFPLSRRGFNLLEEFRAWWRLVRIYQEEKPAVVHHFTIKCIMYGSFAAKLAQVPQIINAITGLGYMFSAGGFLKEILQKILFVVYRIVLKNTETVFQNPDDQRLFLKIGLIKKDNHLIRSSGVNIQRFTPQPEKSGIPVVVLPARMLREKGIEEFVGAARMLMGKGISARFVLVGDVDEGNPATISRRVLENWKDEEVIEWWGWQSDMLAVYAQAHIICLPSYYGEGVPRTLLEAGACARPLVATDASGCREVVVDSENGFLVPVRNADALSIALEKLLLSPPLRKKMGINSRKMIVNNFSEEKVLSETLIIYQKGKER